ncbi:MAG: GNAT family N-acetyltransferase [Thermodesulfobacteriota bacterium]
MEESFLSKIQIRPMRMEDLDAIIEIDRKIFGKARPDYWKKIIVPNSQYPFSSLVAEFDGKVVGFIVGEVSGGEFGIPDTVGWLTTIGVDPEYQHRGVARELSKTFIQNLKSIGVSTVYTLVNWNDWDLLSFFRKMGFTRGGEMINLQLKIG